MAASADPAFEVATIKPSDPANGSSGFQLRGRRIVRGRPAPSEVGREMGGGHPFVEVGMSQPPVPE